MFPTQSEIESLNVKIRSIRDRANRLEASIRDQARQTCKAAGLDPNLLGIHPHNAMVSFEHGQPWTGVDYSLVRKTLWLMDRAFDPTRVADRIIGRLWARTYRMGES